MKGAIGVLNGNSRISHWLRDCEKASTTDTTDPIIQYAERVAVRFTSALHLLKQTDFPAIVRRGEVIEREVSRQLVLLTEYMDGEK